RALSPNTNEVISFQFSSRYERGESKPARPAIFSTYALSDQVRDSEVRVLGLKGSTESRLSCKSGPILGMNMHQLFSALAAAVTVLMFSNPVRAQGPSQTGQSGFEIEQPSRLPTATTQRTPVNAIQPPASSGDSAPRWTQLAEVQ